MSLILARIFLILVPIFFVGAVVWFITLPWRMDRQFERELMYGYDNPVFRLEKGVLVIDWKTFYLSNAKRFLARKFPKSIIVLEGGKELIFYNGIQRGAFTYEGRLSLVEEQLYQTIKEYIG